MEVLHVYRRMNGSRVIERRPGKGETLPAVMEALGYPWLPGLIQRLQRSRIQIEHPQGKEWYVVFCLDYQPQSRPTARLLIRPSVSDGRLVPYIPLAAERQLTIELVHHYVSEFLNDLGN